jgi:hypothetical protein
MQKKKRNTPEPVGKLKRVQLWKCFQHKLELPLHYMISSTLKHKTKARIPSSSAKSACTRLVCPRKDAVKQELNKMNTKHWQKLTS